MIFLFLQIKKTSGSENFVRKGENAVIQLLLIFSYVLQFEKIQEDFD